MKNMKLVIICLFVSLLFAACQTQNSGTTFGVALGQIEDDLKQLDTINDGVITSTYIPTTEYELVNYEIIKRQTNPENKEDIIYCNVTISNGYIKTLLEYKLLYTFYDQGGWILDDASILSKESVPLRGIEENNITELRIELRSWIEKNGEMLETFEDYAEELFRSDGYICKRDCFSLQSRNFDNVNYIDTLYYGYHEPDKNFELTGYLSFMFDQSEGWILQYDSAWEQADGCAFVQITDVNIDWNRVMTGEFLFEANNDSYRANISLDIHNFDSLESSQVTYENDLRYYENGTLRSGKYAYDSTATLSKTKFTITFNYIEYYADILGHPSEKIVRKVLFYNFLNDSWVENSTYNLNLVRLK